MMCGGADTSEGTSWQQSPPDEPGEWLWVNQFECGCVHRAGIAFVPKRSECESKVGMESLGGGLWLSWEGQAMYPDQRAADVTAWRKITLPPHQWLEK